MARYAIGDIQGCYNEFMQLLAKINFNPSIDVLYLVGDLVNRGPESLKTLQWVYDHQDSVVTVLGNHDIYLIGRYAKILKATNDDTIDDILNSANAPKLIDYLRTCPLIFQDGDYILVHAGVYPKMDFNKLVTLNHTISHHLQSVDYPRFIKNIYGNKPNIWNDKLSLIKQMRFVVNACTRMRFLDAKTYALDYKYKGETFTHPHTLIPWFKSEMHPSVHKKILFGHWAALGFFHDERFIALDTGCVWGRKLTAINIDTFDITQISAQ